MNKIHDTHKNLRTINDFVDSIYKKISKPILFWDTCSLLNIIRFLYRDEGNVHDTLKSIQYIADKICKNEIYSVSCDINITEWNNNIDNTLNDVRHSLQKTTDYHKNAIEAINVLYNYKKWSEPLTKYSIEFELQSIALAIIDKTYFLKVDKDIAFNALQRVKMKQPPAKKKNEFKDCAIWETMLSLCRNINMVNPTNNNVFYTVNTEDFCCLKNEQKVFIYELTAEAVTNNFSCCNNINDVLNYLSRQ